MQVFRDRDDAGEQLAERVRELGLRDPVVLALPRGGVPVGAVVAERLGAPLDVTVVRKIAVPDFPETAVGAVTAEGAPIMNPKLSRMVRADQDELARSAEEERAEARRRVAAYRGDRPAPQVAGRDVVVVDDGLATGMSARAALSSLAEQGAASVTLAVPVCSPDAARDLEDVCDRVVCVLSPPQFQAVSLWYERFPQIDDTEVQELLRRAGVA
ncbi:phosphoribosyltransferase family protein [Streptomonospora sp. PA3]|uniref:phosphoribosyltransferase n=1 Tax=Streptomonospora sp. PA3 TaxID=2607326 RepID=UPI0031BA6D56